MNTTPGQCYRHNGTAGAITSFLAHKHHTHTHTKDYFTYWNLELKRWSASTKTTGHRPLCLKYLTYKETVMSKLACMLYLLLVELLLQGTESFMRRGTGYVICPFLCKIPQGEG